MKHLAPLLLLAALAATTYAAQPLRVFIFAGQSNMEGADSKPADIDNFPPFAGLAEPQENVRFAYSLGREDKTNSDGWTTLQPVRNMVGPELSFARKVTAHTDAPVAIIKCAAGGTHLGGDWNPDDPQGFKMYPLALGLVRASLAELDRQNVPYRLEGFMWHQGENDMFNEGYMADYGKNLANFIARWRRDLEKPDLKFYVGELCTKTIWGMDLRPRMYAISQGQKSVCAADPLVDYIPTSHVGVEIGGGVGLHYHYGTLGQLEHGENYADAYLRHIGVEPRETRTLTKWPYTPGSPVKLFVLAGHRNMQGERAFTQQLTGDDRKLADDDHAVAFRYSLGGGVYRSRGWEPLGPSGLYHNFGPELSFARAVRAREPGNIAIAKFSHGGSQMIDWTPEGSMAKDRNLYPAFVDFVRTSVQQLEAQGHEVQLAGIFYHIGENDMSMPPYRQQAPGWLAATIKQSRLDLERPGLKWFVSQQPPTDDGRVNEIEVTSRFAALADADPHTTHLKAFSLPEQPKKLVLDTPGILALGETIATAYLGSRKTASNRNNNPSLPDGVTVARDIEYARPGGSPLLLDLYRPAADTGHPLPVVLWVHGGGWLKGSKDNARNASWLAARGFAVASINYRLATEARWPAQIDDCRNAVRWLRENADRYHLDPGHIGAFGASAGGHLVALMGTRPYPGGEDDPARVQAVCDWFGPTELLTMPPNVVAGGRTEQQVANSNGAKLLGATVRDVPELARQASALDNVSPDDAPFLIMHGSDDPGVPLAQSEKLHAALTAAGVPSQLHIVDGAGHGGPLFQTTEIRDKIAAFFSDTLAPGQTKKSR